MHAYIEVLKEANIIIREAHPEVTETIRALREYSTEIYRIMEDVAFAGVDIKAAMILRLEKRGFTKEEAILLTIDSSVSLANALKTFNSGKGGRQDAV